MIFLYLDGGVEEKVKVEVYRNNHTMKFASHHLAQLLFAATADVRPKAGGLGYCCVRLMQMVTECRRARRLTEACGTETQDGLSAL
jgi:hypothetical protein